MRPGPKARGRDVKPGQPLRLDRDVILSAAEQILNTDGLDAMTMRRVGADLDVDPTAIYRHFRSKDELVFELADRAFGRVELPPPETSWQEALLHMGMTIHAIYAVHPDFASVLVRQADDTPNLERITEHSLALLAQAGLDPEQSAQIQAVMVAYIAGFGLFNATLGEEANSEKARDRARRMYGALPAERFPHAVAAAPHLFPGPAEINDLGLEILIEAIERLGQQQHPSDANDGDAR